MTPGRFAVGGTCGPWHLRADLDCAPPAHLDRARGTHAREPSLHCSVVRRPAAGGSDRPQYLTDPRPGEDFAEVLGRAMRVSLNWHSGACQWSWPQPGQTEASTAMLIERSWLLTMQALALRHGGVLLHGCSLARDGQAAIVIGPSGAGKTTLARRLPAHALHDDVAIVVRDGPQWRVWAQDVYRPFGGATTGVFNLHRILWLSPQRQATRAVRLDSGAGVMTLLGQAFDAQGAGQAPLADAVADLANTCGAWSLDHCLADDEQRLLQALWAAA